MIRYLKKSGYFIIYILAFLFFAWALFPSAMAAKAITGLINEKLSGEKSPIRVIVGDVSLAFPPGIVLKSSFLRLSTPDNRKTDNRLVAMIDTVTITPNYVSLLSQEKIFSFKGAAHEGFFKGEFHVADQKAGGVSPFSVRVMIEDVRISAIPYIKSLSESLEENFTEPKNAVNGGELPTTSSRVSGKLSGNIAFEASGPYGALDADIGIADGALEISTSFMKIGHIRFKELETKMAVKSRKFILEKCIITGNIKNRKAGELTGSAELRKPFRYTALDFEGVLEPTALLGNAAAGQIIEMMFNLPEKGPDGYRFKVKGTLAKPIVEPK